jgi:hypothetical protein
MYERKRHVLIYDEPKQEVPRRLQLGRLLLVLACISVVGGVLVWQLALHMGTASSRGEPAAAASSPATLSSSPLTPPVPLTALYDEIVKEQVAQGLHLTVAQVTAQLQAEPMPDLREIGKQQGLAQDQLYRLVFSALQMADNHMVGNGTWTGQQANAETLYWSQQDQLSLINGVASLFMQH